MNIGKIEEFGVSKPWFEVISELSLKIDIHIVVAALVSARETRAWKNRTISQALNAGPGLSWKLRCMFFLKWSFDALSPRDKREVLKGKVPDAHPNTTTFKNIFM